MHFTTFCAQVHELSQNHCGDNREGTSFSWLHIYYAHLAFVRFEQSVCRAKIYIYIFEQLTRMCNCRDKASCPMDGNCLQKCFVYQVQVDSANSRKYYLGTAEDEFKTRYTYTTILCNSEIKVMKRKLNFQNMFGNWKTKVKILPSNRVLLQKPPLIYVVVNAVTYAWRRNGLSLKLILGHY